MFNLAFLIAVLLAWPTFGLSLVVWFIVFILLPLVGFGVMLTYANKDTSAEKPSSRLSFKDKNISIISDNTDKEKRRMTDAEEIISYHSRIFRDRL
jgi:hypothetical protein